MSCSTFLALIFRRVGFWLLSGGFNFNLVVMMGLGNVVGGLGGWLGGLYSELVGVWLPLSSGCWLETFFFSSFIFNFELELWILLAGG